MPKKVKKSKKSTNSQNYLLSQPSYNYDEYEEYGQAGVNDNEPEDEIVEYGAVENEDDPPFLNEEDDASPPPSDDESVEDDVGDNENDSNGEESVHGEENIENTEEYESEANDIIQGNESLIPSSNLPQRSSIELEKLWFSCSEGDETTLNQILMKLEAHIDTGDMSRGGKTALILAAEKNHIGCMRLLLANGANINEKNEKQSSALLIAAYNGHLPSVQFLVQQGADVSMANVDGYCPTLIAAKFGKSSCLRYLIDEGCNPNTTNMQNGTCAVLYAAIGGHYECLCTLLRQDGVDINASDGNGMTALMATVLGGHFDCADLLVRSGADVFSRSNDGKTVGHYATEMADTAVLEMLLKHGIDVYAEDDEGNTPLRMYTAKENANLTTLKSMVLGRSKSAPKKVHMAPTYSGTASPVVEDNGMSAPKASHVAASIPPIPTVNSRSTIPVSIHTVTSIAPSSSVPANPRLSFVSGMSVTPKLGSLFPAPPFPEMLSPQTRRATLALESQAFEQASVGINEGMFDRGTAGFFPAPPFPNLR